MGSRNAEPSTITSPPNQIPVDPFGRQNPSPVYGPSELGQLYEGNIGQLNFGLAGKSTTDGGSLDGGFVWVSPKYKSNAGFKATPGGGTGSKDDEFNQIDEYARVFIETEIVKQGGAWIKFPNKDAEEISVQGVEKFIEHLKENPEDFEFLKQQLK